LVMKLFYFLIYLQGRTRKLVPQLTLEPEAERAPARPEELGARS
jgi:hypothetical protein